MARPRPRASCRRPRASQVTTNAKAPPVTTKTSPLTAKASLLTARASPLTAQEIRLEVGRRIRAARQRRCLSQRELGYQIGCDRPTVGRIEAGQRSPDVCQVFLIAEALEVQIGDLLPLTRDEILALGDPEDPGWVLIRAEELEQLIQERRNQP